MAVTIKSKKEIELMREAGKMLEEVHNKLADFVKPGISTLEIDQFGEKAIRDLGCVPNFLNYNGYPARSRTWYSKQRPDFTGWRHCKSGCRTDP